MLLQLKPWRHRIYMPALPTSPKHFRQAGALSHTKEKKKLHGSGMLVVRACQGNQEEKQRRSFLSLEEAGLVEISGLSTHERFLCRLTYCGGYFLNYLIMTSQSIMAEAEAAADAGTGTGDHDDYMPWVSSLNLLRVIAEQEGLPIEELNAGRICDWFLKDKLKREQNLESAVLQWDDSGFQM